MEHGNIEKFKERVEKIKEFKERIGAIQNPEIRKELNELLKEVSEYDED